MTANKPRIFRVRLGSDNCFYFISRSGREPTRNEVLGLALQHLLDCFLDAEDMSGIRWSFDAYEWCGDTPIQDIDGGAQMELADAANLCAEGQH